MEWDAIILAGGRGTRLGGVDKAELVVGGRTLLEAAVSATGNAEERCIVGPDRPGLQDSVRCVVEEPAHTGIAAAVDVGLRELRGSDAAMVALVAADQPSVDQALPVVLSEVWGGSSADGWIAADPYGSTFPLLGVYRKASLERRIARLKREDRLADASLGDLLEGLRLKPVRLLGYLCADIDTPTDIRRLGLDPAQLLPV